MSKLVRKKALSSLIAQGENRDPYIDDVKTLFHFNGSDGQDSSVYLDDSPNKFSMTGGPPNSGVGPYDNQGNFSPFSANGWSHHFSGISSDNAYVDFTSAGIKNYEPWNCSLWFYRDATDTTQRGLIQINGVSGTQSSYLYITPYNLQSLGGESFINWGFSNPNGGNGAGTMISTAIKGNKEWNHLLISYNGSHFRIFFNGVNARTQSANFNTTGNGTINIGRTPNSTGNTWLGFISDVHFENASAQTSNFSPPTRPIEPTASTGLLALNKSVIYDESKYATTPTFGTKFGNSWLRAQPYSPFKLITKEQKSQYYSTYFNGTNQYLTFDPKPNVKGIDFQYDDFSSGAGTPGITYKGSTSFSNNFVYITTSAGGTGGFYREHSQRWDKDFSVEWRFECSGGSGADGFVLQFVQNNIDLGGGGGNCGRVQSSTTIHALNFKTFGTNRVVWYKNNVQQQSNNTSIGLRSDVRYWFDYDHSAQTGALYMATSDTKPGTPFVTYSNFVFDSSKYHLMFSAATGGLTDNHILKRLKVHNVEGGDRGLDAFHFASTNYPSAIEAWIYLDGSASSTSDRIICAYGGGTYNWNLTNGLAYTLFVNSNSYLQINTNSGDGTNAHSVTSTTQIIEKQWYHIAVCYMGNGGSNANAKPMRLFVNGVAEPALTSPAYGTPGRNATFPSSLTVFSVGSAVPHGGTGYFGGYISNLIVSVYKSTTDKIDGNYGTGPLYGGYQGAGIPFRPRIALRQPGFNCTLLTCRDAYLINRATIASALPVAYNNVLTVPFSQATGSEIDKFALNGSSHSYYFDGKSYISTQATENYPINLTGLTESLVEQEGCTIAGDAHFISGNLLRLIVDGTQNNGGVIKTKFAQSLNKDFSVKVEMRGSGSAGNIIAQGWSLSFSTDSELIPKSHTQAPNANGTTVAQFGFEQYTYNRMFYTNDQNEKTNTNSLGTGVWVGTKHYWFDYDHSASTMSVYYASTNSKPATANQVWTGVIMPDQPIYAAIQAGTGGVSGSWDLAEWTLYAQNTYIAGKLLDTSSFSLEAWVYRTATSNTSPYIIQLGSSSSNRFALYITSSNYLELYTNVNGTVTRITDTETFPSERWVHVAITSVTTTENAYSPAITSVYKNGKRIGYVDRSIPVCTVAHVGFQGYGTASNDYWQGYISNIFLSNRVVKYSGETFTVPTEPLIDPDSTSDAVSSQCTLLFTGQENTLINKPYLLQGPALRPHGAIQTSKLNPFIGLHNSVEQNYSVEFNGSNQYLRCDTALDDFSSILTEVTLEGWFYCRSVDTTVIETIFGINYNNGAENNFLLSVRSSGGTPNIWLHLTTYSGNVDQAIGAFDLNTWNHVAAYYDGSITKIYLNGTKLYEKVGTYTRNWASCAFCIGAELDSTNNPGNYFDGYISNVRIVNDTIYKSDFTPPDHKLGITLENRGGTVGELTKFLSCQSQSIVDNSPDAHTITNNNSTPVSSYNPFTEEPLNEITTAGSLYFSPNLYDHLQTSTTSSKFDIRNQACTVDLWFWNPYGQQVDNPPNKGRIFAFFDDSTDTWFSIGNRYSSNGGLSIQAESAGTNVINTAISNCLAQGWNHLVFSKEAAGVFRVFTNGILKNTSTVAYGNTLNGLQFNRFSVGGNPKESTSTLSRFSGFISNVRYIKGECLYKESFTPPSSPTQPIPGTELLLNFNNGAAQDQRGMYNWEVHGDASLSTKQVLFGTSSFYGGTSTSGSSGRIYFLGDADGTINNFFSSASNSGYNYQNSDFIYTASENFTWEGWYYIDSNAGTAQNLMSIGGEPPSNNGNYRYSLKVSTSNILQINVSYVGDTNIGTATVPRREWVHIAWVKVGTTSTFYCNGVSHGTYTRNSTVGNTYSNYSGSRLSHYIGDPNVYVNEFRITKGVARYTSNFTPPSAPFPDR